MLKILQSGWLQVFKSKITRLSLIWLILLENFNDSVYSMRIAPFNQLLNIHLYVTGKFLSEALIFASTNPQYDDRLFSELTVQYMKIPSSNLGRTCCVQKLFLIFRTIFVRNMFYPCSAKTRVSDKDLPVTELVSQQS
jgi:hypothetical protein